MCQWFVRTQFKTNSEDYDFLEFFAGAGTMCRMMRALGSYKSARFDIKDATRRGHNTNFMDLNSTSGFAQLVRSHSVPTMPTCSVYRNCFAALLIHLSLAIFYCLKLRSGLVHFGIKCSSFCGLNRGTSGRSACSSLGFTGHSSVVYSNKMLERTGCCIHNIRTSTPEPLQPHNLKKGKDPSYKPSLSTLNSKPYINSIEPYRTLNPSVCTVLLCVNLNFSWSKSIDYIYIYIYIYRLQTPNPLLS